jgi:hypothetical protein
MRVSKTEYEFALDDSKQAVLDPLAWWATIGKQHGAYSPAGNLFRQRCYPRWSGLCFLGTWPS